MVYSSHKTAESDQFKTWEAKEETLPSRSFTSERSRSLEPVRTILDRPRINAGPAEITNAGVARLSPFNFGRGGMFVGPIVSQSPSGQSLIAFRRRHGCGAIAHRSANAYPWVSPGTPQACSGFRPAAFGSFVISQAHADTPIPVGSHRLPIAVTAGEQSPGAVQLGDLAAAIGSVCSNRTYKPWSLSTETTRRPFDADTLLDIDPILGI